MMWSNHGFAVEVEESKTISGAGIEIPFTQIDV